MELLAKLVEILKIKTRYWVAGWFVCAAIIVMPRSVLRAVDLELMRDHSRPVFVGIWLLATVYLLANAGAHLSEKRHKTKLAGHTLERMRASLAKLSIEEKQVLCLFILRQTKTVNLSMQDGVVQGLVGLEILYRASSLGSAIGMMFDYNIQPWAWDHLNEHRNLITEGVPVDHKGRFILNRG